MRMRGVFAVVSALIGLVAGVPPAFAQNDDSPTKRYYEQLRRRGLHQLAERHAEFRLSDPLLSADRRIELVIELSRTLAAHALSAADDEQGELWDKASAVLADEISVTDTASQRLLLETYAALVPSARVEQLVWDLEAAPFDEPAREALDNLSQDALGRLKDADQSLAERIRTLETKKKGLPGVTVFELRRLRSQLGLRTGFVLQARARLSPAGSQERHSDLLDADDVFRKLVSANGGEERFAAKQGLAIGNRLRDELDRAVEMLDALEREQTPAPGEFWDSIRLERAQVLLTARRPDDAAQTLLQLRAGRDRLSGEYWMAFLQTLTALRRAALERNAPNLAAEIAQRAEAALKEVDEQVGGPWSRRCRAIWSAAESLERYGPRITALVSRGKSEYLAGRVDEAVTAYSSALELAQEDGKTDLEMDAGYTLAAILARQNRWDEVVQRCRQLVSAHPRHAKAAEIDLLKLHALGTSYDQDRTVERKAAYQRGLTDHLQQFSKSPTAPEAEFLRGQFLETTGDVAEAFAAYLKVAADHPRGPAAVAAAARCSVVRLLQQRETERRDPMLEQQTLQYLAAQWKQLPEDRTSWSDAQIELVYHSVRALLLVEPPAFAQAERWLDRLDEAIPSDPPAEPTELRMEIRRRIDPLRLIALAGQGRPQEAERLLGTLEESSAMEQLAVVEELSQLDIPSPAAARRSLVEMQLAAAERLKPRRKELTAPQRRRLDWALANSYLATAQPAKAVAVYEQLLADHPRDQNLARQLGELLAARSEPECLQLAKSCWQRVESAHKQGTREWFDARAWVIECGLRSGELAEARKLLKVTKLIYSKSWGDEMQRRYAGLESRLK